MNSPLFLFSCYILLFIGIIIPFFAPIYLFCSDNEHWAWISIAASIISFIINSLIAKCFLIFQSITHTAIIVNILAFCYHTLLLTAVLILAPSKIWWLLILATWEIARHPLQDISSITQKNEFERPLFYLTNPIIRTNTATYCAYHIHISGYASIIAAVVLLLL